MRIAISAQPTPLRFRWSLRAALGLAATMMACGSTPSATPEPAPPTANIAKPQPAPKRFGCNFATASGAKIPARKSDGRAELVIQSGHNFKVGDLAFSPDGDLLVTAASDGTGKLWRVRDGRLLRTLRGHVGAVNAVAFSPTGDNFVTGDSDGIVQQWSRAGEPLGAFKRTVAANGMESGQPGIVSGLVYAPDGSRVLGSSSKFEILTWRTSDRAHLGDCSLNFGAVAYALAISPDGNRIAVGGFRAALKVWDGAGRLLHDFSSKSEERQNIKYLAISPDGKWLAAIGGLKHNAIRLWNLDDGSFRSFAILEEASQKTYWDAYGISFLRDGTLMAIYDKMDKGMVRMLARWTLDGRKVAEFTCKGCRATFELSPDEETIAMGGSSRIELRTVDGKLLRSFGSRQFSSSRLTVAADRASFVSSNKTIASAWSIGGRHLRTWNFEYTNRPMLYSPDGRWFAYGTRQKQKTFVTLEALATGRKQVLDCPGGGLIAFSRDGALVAAECSPKGSKTGVIRIWSTRDGRKLQDIRQPNRTNALLLFAPDGKKVVLHDVPKAEKGKGMYGTRFCTIADGRCASFDPDVGWVSDVAFHPDGRQLMAGGSSGTRLWTLEGKPKSVQVEAFKLRRKWVGGVLKTIEKEDLGTVDTIAYSSDGRSVVLAGGSPIIRLRSANGKLIKKYTTHHAGILDVAFGPKDEYLLFATYNSTNVLSLKTGHYFMVVPSETDWIIATPDGYFDASKNGGDLMAMASGKELFGVDQFAIHNNRPDIILERLGLGTPALIKTYKQQYRKRLRRMGFKEGQLSGELHVPEVEIVSTKQNGKHADIQFDLRDSKYQLNRYNIYVNDVPILGELGKRITGTSQKGLRERVELTAGVNKIEVSCINEKGAESYRALTEVEYKKKTSGDLYFLGFGVSKYKDKLLNLKYAHQDARDLAKVFRKMKGKRFKKVFTKTYLNKQVTVANIRAAKAFLKDAKVDDTFVLFIAGHGIHDDDEEATYYYLTHDADKNNLAHSAARFESIEALLHGIAPRNKLFLMDTCESGEVEEDTQKQFYSMAGSRGLRARTSRGIKVAKKGAKIAPKRSFLLDRERYIFNDLIRRSGAIVFSSSRGGEFSYERDSIRNGFFTEEIIKSLTSKAADKNNDRLVSTDEMRDYVSAAVPKATAGLQHPTVDRDNIHLKFGFPIR